MSHRTDHPTDDVIAQFLRTRSADPDLGLLDDIIRTVGATPQDRPWFGPRPMGLPRRTLLIVAFALLLATMGAIAVGTRFLQPELPASPFKGTWISTSDADGGTQTMTVDVSADGVVEITVRDDVATVCALTPSTMTGAGRLDGNAGFVIPSPVYTCDDGSEPVALSGPPLEETLRDWSLVLDTQTATLRDGVGGVWLREGAEDTNPDPIASDFMWPQSSIEEVREAQELADAGDPGYSWQVDPALVGDAEPWGAEIFERFLREALGWEESSKFGGYAYGEGGGLYDELVFIRCAPGRTNPLYPDDPEGRGCAPTVDDFRYETVMVTLEQPVRRDPSGIWVVTGWEMLQPGEPSNLFDHLYPDFTQRQVEQVAPPSDAEATALLDAFLGARVDGEGAQQYVHRHAGEEPLSTAELVPILLYATTGDSPYERYEIDRLGGPEWPSGWKDFRTRLIAEDGTVVEQSFAVIRQEDGGLGLVYGYPTTGEVPTTENGQAVPVPYSFIDGTVTFAAAPSWNGAGDVLGSGQGPTFAAYLGNPGHAERLEIVADPLPVATGCEPGPAPADAEAFAESIRSDPDLETTAPVAVTIGGIDALQMDVVAAPGASVCDGEGFGGPLVMTDGGEPTWAPGWLGDGGRMRLYLLDLPEESASRILGIAIAAPEAQFDAVLEAAAPVIDSIEFHAP